MRKTVVTLTMVGALLAAVPQVSAQTPSPLPTGTSGRMERIETRMENREQAKEKLEQLRDRKAEIRDEIKEKIASKQGEIKNLIRKFARLFDAAVVSKTGTSLSSATFTVKDTNGKTVTVTADANTKYMRRFWGKIGSLDEIASGDKLMIVGTWTDDARTTVLAKLIRDQSIQKRNGVFFGTVKSTGDNGFVIDSQGRGTLTVTLATGAKLIARNQTAIVKSDIAVGHRIRIRGLWDTQAKTVTQVTEVKDFDLPVRSVTGKPATTGTPAVTTTPATTAAVTVTPKPSATPSVVPTTTPAQ